MADTKASLRAQCRALRDSMTLEAVVSASARIGDWLASWSLFQQSQTVMAYLAFGNEVNLIPLIGRFPAKRWIVPRTLDKPEPHLVLHLYDAARLVRHRFGMLEPDASLPVVEPGELDMVLAPGIVFDRRGYRLGFGGGFYDRFLPCVRGIRVGIVYQALIVACVPNEAYDQRVDWLACEAGILPTINE
jgi:5-formyltetrahydrofolate cyclo-ligase